VQYPQKHLNSDISDSVYIYRMLTQTTENALRALLYLAGQSSSQFIPPRQIATVLGASPTYMAKILNQLVKADILRSQRGPLGGVRLARSPREITLLDVFEACQGVLRGDYCDQVPPEDLPKTCAFHQAMDEIDRAIRRILRRWSLADFLSQPGPAKNSGLRSRCKFMLPTDGTAPTFQHRRTSR
jgi:Rrf2 family protein